MHHVHLDVTDSTNLQARALAAQHPGEAVAVSAAEQTAGRGRQGRTWHSPRGGAWLSVAWPATRPAAAYATASLAAAAAVRRALCEVAPEVAEELRIKWPNDILLNDRKVAGILCEMVQTGTGESARGAVLIVGVGVNVAFDVALLGADLRHPATTLRERAGREVSVESVVDAVANHIAAAIQQYEQEGLDGGLLDELRSHLAYVGSERTVSAQNGVVTGTILGLNDAGRLLIDSSGLVVACESGEFVA
jgi:BirA family biotin operon repressor/biotin-[acetyl-CoA-carboxylase] ligase